MTLSSRWFSSAHAKDQKAKQEMESAVRSSRVALERLRDILKGELADLDAPTKVDYDSPSWAFKEADRHGARRSYRNILTLLEFLDDNGN